VKLSVVSWNVHGLPRPFDLHFLPWDRSPHHGERVRHILERVGSLRPQPDLIFLQEVWRDDDAAAIKSLAGYTACEVPNGPIMRPTGLLTLVRGERWRVLSSDPYFYLRSANTDTRGKKGLLLTKLQDRDGRKITVINTHLQSQYATSGEKTYPEIRASQIATLTEKAEDAAAAGVPMFACGDFNTYPYPSDARVYTHIADGRPWIDLTREARARCGCETNFDSTHKGKMDGWIDYVLAYSDPTLQVRADISLLANRAIDDPYSDHQGLHANVTIEAHFSPLALAVTACALSSSSTRREWLALCGSAIGRALPLL
jgi:endonuclease/exonuclease/phosphatase family metal-dependent hydrolase